MAVMAASDFNVKYVAHLARIKTPEDRLEPLAAEALSEAIGSDSARLASELEKLALYVGAEPGRKTPQPPITAAAVEALREFRPRCNPWLVSDVEVAIHLLTGAGRAAHATLLANRPPADETSVADRALQRLWP